MTDQSYWRHSSEVALWEGVALSLDVDPHDAMQEYQSVDVFAFHHGRFRKRLELATRSLGRDKALKPAQGVIGDDPRFCKVSLVEFAKWCRSVEWEIPEGLRVIASDAGDAKRGPVPETTLSDGIPKRAQSDNLSPKGRRTALCIIGALASMPETVDISQPYKAAGIIAAKLSSFGVDLTEEAVAAWIKDVNAAIAERKK